MRQTYPHWELLIVDDGSTDNTQAVLSQIVSPRIRVFRKENGGTASARNLGLQHARGEFVAFLDADDRWLPDYLESMLQVLRQRVASGQSDQCIVYSWYTAVDEQDKVIHRSPCHRLNGWVFEELLKTESVLLPSTTLIPRAVIEKWGGFNEHHYNEDREFFLRLAKHTPLVPLGSRKVLYLQSTQGKCRAILKHFEQALAEDLNIVDTLSHLLSPAQKELLVRLQLRNLLIRFLMYGFTGSAKRLQSQVPEHTLKTDKKGWLAWLSLKTGINLVYPARLMVQSFNRLSLTAS